jgi:ABC-2 type transport system ATP-binding protein
MPDGVMLDCSRFLPDNSTPDTRLPAVIFAHGFGGSKEDAIPFAQLLSKSGFYTFAYSMRGQGKSKGLSNLISTKEMEDLFTVVEFVRSEPVSIDNRIALTGSSQGGIISFMAGCKGIDVSCIVADLASPEFASSWIENGCVRTTLFWSLNYDSTKVRFNKNVKKMRDWILNDSKHNWKKLSSSIVKNRNFADDVENLNVPILISNSWQDKFFNTLGMIKASDNIKAPFKMHFGAVQGHGSDTTLDEINYHSKLIRDWLNYWLLDYQNGVMDSERFSFSLSSNPIISGHWSYNRYQSSVFPPEGTIEFKLYFHPYKKISGEPNSTSPDTVSFINDVRDKSVSMESALSSNFTGYEFNSKFLKNYIYFETEPLENNLQMTGMPKINLHYSSTADICQYNFQIWEVNPDGNMNFVTRINFTDRNYTKNSKKLQSFYGLAHSHLFWKGNKIRIYVTNIDNGPDDSFLRTNPYVLPVLKRARNYIHMSKTNDSYIEIPVTPIN